MTTLSKSCEPRAAAADYQVTRPRTGTYELEGLRPDDKNNKYYLPSSAFKRLHALYLIHNTLFALQDCSPSTLPQDYNSVHMNDIVNDLKDHVIRLFQIAACCGEFPSDNVDKQLTNLLEQYDAVLEQSDIDTLTASVANIKTRPFKTVLENLAAEDDQKIVDAKKAKQEAEKWNVPQRHGVKFDPTAPWWELPAANGLYMRRTRGYPLRAAAFPAGGYLLQNAGTSLIPNFFVSPEHY